VLARAVALEVAPIRVNIIRPGLVDTPYITGSTLTIDGISLV
jgi:NAD(P)-dependent dehydrogenase (short-subunit alcohol dehydrogenase family)